VKKPRREGDYGHPWALDPDYDDMFDSGSFLRRKYRYKTHDQWKQDQSLGEAKPEQNRTDEAKRPCIHCGKHFGKSNCARHEKICGSDSNKIVNSENTAVTLPEDLHCDLTKDEQTKEDHTILHGCMGFDVSELFDGKFILRVTRDDMKRYSREKLDIHYQCNICDETLTKTCNEMHTTQHTT